jgi:hypothetical protein
MRGWHSWALIGISPLLAAAQVPAEPAAQVRGHAVTHAGEGVTVRVPAAAAYLGSRRFDLYGVADAEVHVFAEGDRQKRLRRLYWIQFESYHPSRPELAYDYADGNERMTLWGTPTWVRAGPVLTNAPTRAGSDREQVVAILRAAGYAIPAEVMNVRMVQLLDDPAGTGRGRRELMLIYSEDLGPTGARLADLVADGQPTARWTPMRAPLIQRAATAFRVTRRDAAK